MKAPFRMTIRARLIFLVLISVLPALGIIVYSGLDRNRREIESAKREALRTVKQFSYDHERAVESTRQFLTTLAKVPEVRNFSAGSAPPLLAELLRQNPLYSTLFVVNAQGIVTASAHPLPPTPISVAERKYFKEAVRAKDFSVGEYAVCPAVKRPVLHFAYPILEADGGFKGLVGVSLDLARYARMFPVDRLPKGTTLAFSDHLGTLLYHYPSGGEETREKIPDPLLSHMTEKTEGVFSFREPNGERRLVAFEGLRLHPGHRPYVHIRVSIPEAKALSQARRAFRINMSLLGIAFGIALLLSWLLGNAVVGKKLGKLVETARRLGQGESNIRTNLDYRSDELGELAKAFDEMAEALERKNQERRRDEETIRREIQDRIRSEEAIKESEQKFRDLVEKSLVGVYLIQDGVFKYVNSTLAEIHGFTVEEMVGRMGPKDLVLSEDWPLVEEKTKARLSGEIEALRFEFRDRTKDDRVVFVEAYGSRTIYQSRPAIIGTLLDITDRKRYEEALNQERKRFQALADNAPFGMVLIDRNGKYTYINPRFGEILGYELSDIPDGRTWFRKAFPDGAYRHKVIAEWLSDVQRAASLPQTPKTFTVTDKYGVKKEISFRFSRLDDGVILMTIEDITTQKRLEDQLLQSQKMEAIGTLAGGIAHDFNNLLMTILGYVSLMLLDKEPHHPDYERLKIIEGQIQSGADLTRQLLGFARGGKYEVKLTDVNELLVRSAEMFGRTKKEIGIFIKQEKDLWPVEVDRGQIEQVLLNLFVNAWQAMPAGGELYLETRNVVFEDADAAFHSLAPGRYVKISVTDTGTGMDEATKSRIFEPFFTTKEMGRGSGLGLASAYGIIKNHGGIINVYSEKGKGSTFNLYLPASDKEFVPEPRPAEEVHTGAEGILLIDDQEAVLKVGEALLKKLGYKVFTAGGGEEAVAFYEKNKDRIDLVILDMVMPAMSGHEAFSALKRINPEVKVILSSGYSIDGQAAAIMRQGCKGFIQKPFTIGELSRKIREVLSPAEGA